jgi:hypothetical protein
MKYCKLRIAWSIVCGIGCVLVIMLWPRSYGTWDRCFGTWNNHGWQLNSMLGHLVLVVVEDTRQIPFFFESLPTEGRFTGEFDKYVLGFYFGRKPSIELGVPFWFIVLVGLAITAAPWLRHLSWRFRLRTLLITITLIAVVLGLAVWAAK